jgi:hypothetical protein
MRIILAATLAVAPLLAGDSEPIKRMNEAATVFAEVMATPDKGIPQVWNGTASLIPSSTFPDFWAKALDTNNQGKGMAAAERRNIDRITSMLVVIPRSCSLPPE